jgi:hypothetical protein
LIKIKILLIHNMGRQNRSCSVLQVIKCFLWNFFSQCFLPLHYSKINWNTKSRSTCEICIESKGSLNYSSVEWNVGLFYIQYDNSSG